MPFGLLVLDWFENQLLPSLKEPSVIVLYNASYHNVRCEETVAPTMKKRKQVLQEWLTKMSAPISPLETKPQLYEKIKRNKPRAVYKTDNLGWSHGHHVLRNVKSYVARNNTTFKLSDVRNLVYRAFDNIDADVWQKAEKQMRGIEDQYAENDGAYMPAVQPIIINMDSDSDESDVEVL